MRRVLGTMTLTALCVGACGGNGGGGYGGPTNPNPPNPSTSNAINVRDNSFAPAATTVAAGTTVTWTWVGNDIHNVTFVSGPSSGDQSNGATFQRTFTASGSFAYSCTRHAGMTGSVTVQ